MKCPHCLVEFRDAERTHDIAEDVDGLWGVVSRKCPACERLVLHLARGAIRSGLRGLPYFLAQEEGQLIRPRGVARAPLSPVIPDELASDYLEACLVLVDSPKASAALSRRCLQHLLREKAGIKSGNLADEIQQVLDSRQLPAYLAENLDVVRNIGNFAAHPMKSTATGEIIEVEPGEAEWNLDVLESLFEFYFVQPAVARAKRDALNAKLAEVGKPPMKG